ncbi:MAG: DsrE family protein [Actinomycetales bacterium]|jgi:predicted peroxiredoxin|uniref:DsrE family protein n=1 Tax=Candidatus Phosphoribacter hodrii TaxID=2953743 RepID=A0A934X5Z1_9MICO|nr:DsrE family protein [Candidatus Phosphoribacter hodrii]MBP8838679.1 DsrE family protein [Dermatophilaceae bacterium]MBK7272094.1 DsrE family protein [Candidatus Phosphoribacter hodrii]HOA03211.1 DsrE family protein [Dermatophilaceae bacterium]HOF37568.1 DsrE family protein [Dermatophilaceae bacterium]
MARSLVVKLTALGDTWPPPTAELERVAQALTVATTALASGIPTSVWLTGEATRLATPGYAARLTLPHAAPFEDLVDLLLGAEVVTVCTQCAARRGLTEADLLPGARIAGAAGFVEQALAEGAQALVY